MGVPFKTILVIDFETRYSTKPQEWCPDGYTLRKSTTEEYIRSALFRDFGASIKEFKKDSVVAQWYRPDELRRVLATYDWSTTAVVAHNAQFDVSILSWKYGIQPAFIFDTLSMARALRGAKRKNGLEFLAKDFGLPEKGSAIGLSDGLYDLPWDVERKLAEYCNHDVWLCEMVFKRFLLKVGSMDDIMHAEKNLYEYDFDDAYFMEAWEYPIKELRLIDMTLRMYTRPLLQLDSEMLADAIQEEKDTREGLLKRLGITDSDLASNDRFADILRGLGIEPPMKRKNPTRKTPNPVGMNYAFAKNDAGFQALLAHDDDNIVSLCEARMKVKSTTERTRAQRFLDISERGALPVPLHYYGAITGRWAAAKGSAINMQNLKRKSFLRKAIMAPEGYVIVVVDLSQIEPRVLAWLADYTDLLEIFRSGKDAYATFGSTMFNIPGLNKEDHPDLRQSAKSALLGCGYQLGWASFAAQLLVGFLGAPPVRYDMAFAKKLGVTRDYIEKFLEYEDNITALNEIPHNCTMQELLVHCVAAKKIIDIYRATAAPVKGFWEMCDELIHSALADGQEYNHKGALIFRKEEIVLPNGMSIRYPNLRQVKDEEAAKRGKARKQWVYGEGAETTKLYAGKVTNNVTQALARIVMTDGLLKVSTRIPLVGTVHDEGLGIVKEAEGEAALGWMIRRMTEEPKYMPGIPLAADGGVHRRYGLAKN
jgi:hypothetical protein